MKTILKFILLAACVIVTSLAFSSCSTVHKNITSSKKTQDSVSTVSKDTTSVSKVSTEKQDFTATGVDVTLDFNPANPSTSQDTVKWTPIYAPINQSPNDTESEQEIANIIKYAVGNYSKPGQIPSSIHIHIDSVKSGSQTTFTTDSVHLKEQTTANVKTTVDTKDKVISKSGLSFGTYAIVGLILVIVIAFFLIKKFIL